MSYLPTLPDWLVACFRIALLGEIYPEIRAIAIGWTSTGEVLIRYYLENEPNERDAESVEIVAVNFDALGGKDQTIKKIDVECVHAVGAMSNCDALSGFLYARKENNCIVDPEIKTLV